MEAYLPYTIPGCQELLTSPDQKFDFHLYECLVNNLISVFKIKHFNSIYSRLLRILGWSYANLLSFNRKPYSSNIEFKICIVRQLLHNLGSLWRGIYNFVKTILLWHNIVNYCKEMCGRPFK